MWVLLNISTVTVAASVLHHGAERNLRWAPSCDIPFTRQETDRAKDFPLGPDHIGPAPHRSTGCDFSAQHQSSRKIQRSWPAKPLSSSPKRHTKNSQVGSLHAPARHPGPHSRHHPRTKPRICTHCSLDDMSKLFSPRSCYIYFYLFDYIPPTLQTTSATVRRVLRSYWKRGNLYPLTSDPRWCADSRFAKPLSQLSFRHLIINANERVAFQYKRHLNTRWFSI